MGTELPGGEGKDGSLGGPRRRKIDVEGARDEKRKRWAARTEDAGVHAHDEGEQAAGFYPRIEADGTFPFPAPVVGESVTVMRVDWEEEGEAPDVAADERGATSGLLWGGRGGGRRSGGRRAHRGLPATEDREGVVWTRALSRPSWRENSG